MPSTAITLDQFLDTKKNDVFTFGVSPVAIDIMTKLKGLEFDECYDKSIIYETEGVYIRLIHYNQLILAKESAGRLKDLADIEYLEQE